MTDQPSLTLPVESHEYFDLSNPQHFLNLLPPKVRERILAIPHELLALSEISLIKKAYGDNPPDDLDYELRLSFWDEYEDCFKNLKTMNIQKICRGICSEKHFYDVISKNHVRLTFIITEPSVSKQRLKYGYHLSLQEMIKIIKRKEEINIKTGTVDTKLMDLKFKIFEYMDQRLHGSLIQKVETKSLNVNVEATPEQAGLAPSADEIDAKIRQIEQELTGQTQQQALTPAREINPIDRAYMDAKKIRPQDADRFTDSRVVEHQQVEKERYE